MTPKQRSLPLFFFLIIFVLTGCRGHARNPLNQQAELPAVKIGFFDGGRTNVFYRTYFNNYFDKENVNVALYTTDLRGKEIVEVPREDEDYVERQEESLNFGKMRGTEIVDLIDKGEFHGGTIGESSFIEKIDQDHPLIAVAMLGYDRTPGKGFLYHQGEVHSSPANLKGKVYIARRAGPGDFIYVMEYFRSLNITAQDVNVMEDYDPVNINQWIAQRRKADKVNLIPQVDEDYCKDWLLDKTIDGGLFHLTAIRKILKQHPYIQVRPMDWMNSAVSQSVLVFNRDFIRDHPEKVQKIVTAYVKRVRDEQNLDHFEKDRSWRKRHMMKGRFKGMSIPQYDYPPLIRIELLDEMQDLLVKYQFIRKKADLSPFIDNSFVEKAYQEIEGKIK